PFSVNIFAGWTVSSAGAGAVGWVAIGGAGAGVEVSSSTAVSASSGVCDEQAASKASGMTASDTAACGFVRNSILIYVRRTKARKVPRLLAGWSLRRFSLWASL